MNNGGSQWELYSKQIKWPVKIYVRNTCQEFVKNGEDVPWFSWSVFIEKTDPSSFLELIDEVTYHLHPIFHMVLSQIKPL